MDTLVASIPLHFSSDIPVELAIAANAALWSSHSTVCCKMNEVDVLVLVFGEKGYAGCETRSGDSQTTLPEVELVDWEWMWMKVPRSRDYE